MHVRRGMFLRVLVVEELLQIFIIDLHGLGRLHFIEHFLGAGFLALRLGQIAAHIDPLADLSVPQGLLLGLAAVLKNLCLGAYLESF